MPKKPAIETITRRSIRLWLAVCVWVVAMSSALEARSGVTPEQALIDAETLTRSFSEWMIYRGDGDSMAPRFDTHHLLLVKSAHQNAIKAGMVALFHDAEGDLVAHTVISVSAEGILTRGLNNKNIDPSIIRHDAVLGVLVGTLAANAPIPASFDLPVAMGKTY